MRKYRNQPVSVDGHKFDSKAEYYRYLQLRQMLDDGDISDLVLQPSYELQKAFRDRDGNAIAKIVYKADFSYLDSDHYRVVEDVKGGKGTQTAVFKLKAKLFKFKYPHLKFKIVEM